MHAKKIVSVSAAGKCMRRYMYMGVRLSLRNNKMLC